MPISFVSGDLFVNRYQVQAFAHGCNCQGSMGAGIAKSFRERYPAMYEAYRARCRAEPRQFNLGDAWLWQEEAQPAVFNLATQEHYWHARASYEAISTALAAMRQLADGAGMSTIAIPRIGVGYGGLSWPKVRALVEAAFGDWGGMFYVYETFAAEDATSLRNTGEGGASLRQNESNQPPCELPATLAAPARRALLTAGYTSLAQLAQASEAELLRLHGMGSKAIAQLRQALTAQGLTFAER